MKTLALTALLSLLPAQTAAQNSVSVVEQQTRLDLSSVFKQSYLTTDTLILPPTPKELFAELNPPQSPESSMYDFVLNKFLCETPNTYRHELFKEERPKANLEYDLFRQAQSTGMPNSGFDVLVFDGKTQKLYHINHTIEGNIELNGAYTASSARYGFSNKNNSKKTPTGLFFIETKQGDGARVGTVFDYTHNHLPPRRIVPGQNTGNTAYMTTRRMDFESWRGLAIHGTNHEWYLGKPRSHGCIRLSNTDVIALFDTVGKNTPLYISPDLWAEIGDLPFT